MSCILTQLLWSSHIKASQSHEFHGPRSSSSNCTCLWVLGHLEGPGQVAEVHGAAQPRVGLQQAHDDGHGRLVVAGAAGALLRVDHVHADVGVLPCREHSQHLTLGLWGQGHPWWQRRDAGASSARATTLHRDKPPARLQTQPCSSSRATSHWLSKSKELPNTT